MMPRQSVAAATLPIALMSAGMVVAYAVPSVVMEHLAGRACPSVLELLVHALG